MDRIVIIRDGEQVLDVHSSVYLVIAVDPANKEVWTRQTVEAVGGIQEALYDPLQLAARAYMNAQEIRDAVQTAIDNTGMDLSAVEICRKMIGIIREREAAENA